MNKRKLGWSGLELSVIGCGCWAMGGAGWAYSWGPQDDKQSIAAIHAALDHGVNWVDTAAIYGLGHSEEVVGRALRGRRAGVIIATKCSLIWDAQKNISDALNRDSVRRECEASLRRLGVDVIDLYQIHWPKDEARLEEGWETLQELRAEGKIRFGGVSNFSVEQLERCQPRGRIASLQPPYSMMRRQIEGAIMPYCAREEIGIVVYSPMFSGLLTGAWDAARRDQLPASDWRKHAANFQSPQFDKIINFVEQLRPIAENLKLTLPQLAIAWTLRRPEVTSAIVGVRDPAQAAEIAGAGDAELDKESLKKIDALLAVF